jgi:murein DD-endopeptidase MepM/ murein hydrolase activator NlpD
VAWLQGEVEVVKGWRRIVLLGLWILLCEYVAGCSQAIYHNVRSGETLSVIAQQYGVSTQEIARYNAIRNPDKLEVGQMLRIPPGKPQQAASSPKVTPQVTGRSLPASGEDDSASLSEKRRGDSHSPFSWPVEGPITSKFGPRNGSFHDGIDIAASLGTQVMAAADGKVIFSDVLRGYGNVVILRHPNGYLTVYAHNRANLVKEGQAVRQGDSIAEVGQSGRATGASLHFEVRKDNLARDPLRHLPQDRRTVQSTAMPRTAQESTTR